MAAFINDTWTDVTLTGVSSTPLAGVGNFGGGSTIDFGGTFTDFVLSLKAGSDNNGVGGFGLYYFAGSYSSVELTSTWAGQDLSHWNIYGGRQTSVPEPGTMLLLGTGLLGMAFVRRREDDA